MLFAKCKVLTRVESQLSCCLVFGFTCPVMLLLLLLLLLPLSSYFFSRREQHTASVQLLYVLNFSYIFPKFHILSLLIVGIENGQHISVNEIV